MTQGHISAALKETAERAMALHDHMPVAWRNLCNEYGERAVQLFGLAVPTELARLVLAAEREHGFI